MPAPVFPISISEHAVDRLIERHLPQLRDYWSEANRVLHELRCRAELVENCPSDLDGQGQSIWRARREGSVAWVLLVVDHKGEIKTVLP